MTSIYHCEQCGGLLASRDEYTEGMCTACQFDRDWRAMLTAKSQVPAALLEPDNENVAIARGNLNAALTGIRRRIKRWPKSQAAGDACETEPGRKGA